MAEDQNLKDAQYRKSLSIAFFNATNSAVSLAGIVIGNAPTEDLRAFVSEWRDWFLDQHRDYYSKTIANVGVSYRAEDTIKTLKTAKSMDDLRQKWLNLSEDERRDGEIIKCIADLKGKLAKKPAKVEAKPEKKPIAKTNEKPRQHKTGVARVAPNKKG